MSYTRLIIPKRITRGPTDLLKALASTIRNQPTAPDTLILDDPYLMPKTPRHRVQLSMSLLSGRKTAKYILNKHPELFLRDDAEPKIKALSAPEEYRDDMDFTIDDLKWCIDNQDPVNGIIAYKALVDRDKVKLDNELLLQFFEMVCYTNEDPMLDSIEQELNYFLRESDKLTKQNWRTNGIASKIFNQIKTEVEPPRVYSAMIAGLSRYNEHQVAKSVFDEFKEFQPTQGLYVEAYEYLLSSIPNLSSSVATAHKSIEEIVKHMEENKVKPSLKIFNSILDTYRRFNCEAKECQIAIQLLNDMRTLGIEPSPFSHASLFMIIARSREGARNLTLIEDLLRYMLKNKAAQDIRDERDTQFFPTAMNTVVNRLNNLQLAKLVLGIFQKNPRLVPSSSTKSGTLDNYFKLLVATESLENILSFYDEYVPIHFRPGAESFDQLAEALDLFQADEETIKRIGQDILKFKMADKIKKDEVFKKDPAYVKASEEQIGIREPPMKAYENWR